MARKPIGKRQRFGIFSRDGYLCGYCGRGPDVVVLEIDHIIPVCQGGTNDDANLRTSCVDCNRGKAGMTVPQAIPPEMDQLRMAQEIAEAKRAIEVIKASVEAENGVRKAMSDAWCQIRGTETVDPGTLKVMVSFAKKHGAPAVIEWIGIAVAKFGPDRNDRTIGKYVSGIRRKIMAGGGEP